MIHRRTSPIGLRRTSETSLLHDEATTVLAAWTQRVLTTRSLQASGRSFLTRCVLWKRKQAQKEWRASSFDFRVAVLPDGS